MACVASATPGASLRAGPLAEGRSGHLPSREYFLAPGVAVDDPSGGSNRLQSQAGADRSTCGADGGFLSRTGAVPFHHSGIDEARRRTRDWVDRPNAVGDAVVHPL